jgi:hypothetical protein
MALPQELLKRINALRQHSDAVAVDHGKRRAASLSYKGTGKVERLTMRLAGVFILAIIASALAGGGAIAAVSLLPDWDDMAGSGLDDAFRALSTMAYVLLSLILYGLAIWRRNRDRHLKRALYILLLVPLLIVVLAMAQIGFQSIDWLREAVGMVQLFVPLWIIALVQWAILHIYLSWRTTRAEAA